MSDRVRKVNPDDTGGTVIMKATAVERPPPDAGTALLVMLYPPGPTLGRRYTLAREEHVVGRLAEVDVPVDSDSVSRRHARLVRVDEGWYVEDLNSTNGTFVNDAPVRQQPLRDGDILRFGEVVMKFLSGSNVEAQYHEEIYRMSILDGLTGVHNKRFFLEFLEREMARARRHDTPVALVLFDIDHFKQVNDRHGHLAGDSVLKELCRRLRPRIRREDLLARYGGEEFACVLPDTSLAGARAFAESLRVLVQKDPFTHEELRLPVTISLGVAVVEPKERLSSDEFIKRADERLYAAKRGGRNRVVS